MRIKLSRFNGGRLNNIQIRKFIHSNVFFLVSIIYLKIYKKKKEKNRSSISLISSFFNLASTSRCFENERRRSMKKKKLDGSLLWMERKAKSKNFQWMESKLERGTLLRNLSTREMGLMVVGAQQLSPLWHMFIIIYQLRWNESEFDEPLPLSSWRNFDCPAN